MKRVWKGEGGKGKGKGSDESGLAGGFKCEEEKRMGSKSTTTEVLHRG